MDEVWGTESESGWETVTVHIGRLRRRFEGWPEFSIYYRPQHADGAFMTSIPGRWSGIAEAFVEAVYGVLSETNARTLRKMNENRVSSTLAVLRSLKDMDEPTRKLVTEVILAFMRSASEVSARWARGGFSFYLSKSTLYSP